MRDLLLTLFIIGMLPVMVVRPFIGLMIWAWISYMNPHRLTWSFAYNFRFNLIVALATILGILFTTRLRFRIPWKGPMVMLFIFTSWTLFTASHAFRPEAAFEQVDRFIKIQLMIIATLLLVKTRRHIISLVTVIALSIGFYGLKGGIFTLTSGGKYRVMGPAQSFFMDNNSLALALIMVLPMLYFVQLQARNRLMRTGLVGVSLLSVTAILGSYSRGGIVGLGTLLIAFWLKTRKKLLILLTLMVTVPGIIVFMPEQWHERMNMLLSSGFESVHMDIDADNESMLDSPDLRNIPVPPRLNDPQQKTAGIIRHDTEIMQDKSVSGRLDAWRLAILIANDRPFIGGGFGAFEQSTFDRYTPGVYRHTAHSIFFEVIGEQGYFGFILWLMMHGSVLLTCRWLRRNTRNDPELAWAHDLNAMLQVGLIGYYSAGAFLGMAYFDLPYHLISIIVLLRVHVENQLKARRSRSAPPANLRWPRFSAPRTGAPP